MNRDFLAVDKCGRELLGLLIECLPFLWAVDSIEANTFSLSVVEYVDGVAVEHGDDGAGKVSKGDD